jgi:hypothetical protein
MPVTNYSHHVLSGSASEAIPARTITQAVTLMATLTKVIQWLPIAQLLPCSLPECYLGVKSPYVKAYIHQDIRTDAPVLTVLLSLL